MMNAGAIKELSLSQAITSAGAEIGNGMATRNGAVALPEEFKLHDLEAYLPVRRRARGNMVTSSAENFARYVNDHEEPGAMVFVDQASMSARAVLNLGSKEKPGHADNIATLKMESTAAYTALRQITERQLTQQQADEFLEDWIDRYACAMGDGSIQENKHVVASVRSMTVESARKVESSEENFGATRSVLESVQAKGKHGLPSFIDFACHPYSGLLARTFRLRMSILTGAEKLSVVLRIVKHEEHVEQMAEEVRALVEKHVGDTAAVLVGTYTASR